MKRKLCVNHIEFSMINARLFRFWKFNLIYLNSKFVKENTKCIRFDEFENFAIFRVNWFKMFLHKIVLTNNKSIIEIIIFMLFDFNKYVILYFHIVENSKYLIKKIWISSKKKQFLKSKIVSCHHEFNQIFEIIRICEHVTTIWSKTHVFFANIESQN